MGKTSKKPRGRPPGRTYEHLARIPMKVEMWEQLGEAAEQEDTSASEIVRRLVEQYLRRRRPSSL